MWSFRIKEQTDGMLLYEVSNPVYPDSTIRGYTARPKEELKASLEKTVKRLNAERGTEPIPFSLGKE